MVNPNPWRKMLCPSGFDSHDSQLLQTQTNGFSRPLNVADVAVLEQRHTGFCFRYSGSKNHFVSVLFSQLFSGTWFGERLILAWPSVHSRAPVRPTWGNKRKQIDFSRPYSAMASKNSRRNSPAVAKSTPVSWQIEEKKNLEKISVPSRMTQESGKSLPPLWLASLPLFYRREMLLNSTTFSVPSKSKCRWRRPTPNLASSLCFLIIVLKIVSTRTFPHLHWIESFAAASSSMA